MTNPIVDPCADIRAMMVERGISDRLVYNKTWLSHITSGAVPIPVNDRRRLRMLAEVLRCEVRYLDKIVAEWNAFKTGRSRRAQA